MAQLKDTTIFGGLSVTSSITASGDITGSRVFGAVFNDYAEYRLSKSDIKAGMIVTEDPVECDYVKICEDYFPKGDCFVVSDTFGNCFGESENSVPVALAGRVLVYIEEEFKPILSVGDYIACSKSGKGRKVTKQFARENPECIIGRVSSIPNYEIWGTDNIKVDGRVWVNVKK